MDEHFIRCEREREKEGEGFYVYIVLTAIFFFLHANHSVAEVGYQVFILNSLVFMNDDLIAYLVLSHHSGFTVDESGGGIEERL